MRLGPFICGLACLLTAGALLTACGSQDSTGTATATAENRPAPPKSAFPAAGGRTLSELLEPADPAELVVSPAGSVYYEGENRFPFGVFQKDLTQVPDAEVALYFAPVPEVNLKAEKENAKGADVRAKEKALEEPALGPYPARIESIVTQPAFRAQTTSDDPDAASVVYSTQIDFPSDGEWRVAAAIRDGDRLTATLLPSVIVGAVKRVPRVGQKAPLIHTPTPEDVGGDLSKLTTRIPPDTQNQVDYADAYGKEPIVLLFATPQFCQSRVCGPVVDVAEQVKETDGDKAAFIHMEIFEDNNPGNPVNEQVKAFHLPTEPWLFAIKRDGTVAEVLQGAFGVDAITEAVEKGGRMSADKKAPDKKAPDKKEAAAPDPELLASFATEARRRCDVIAAGLATETTDFETMRAEAHALKGTAGVVGLRRLAELAGLMESDLAEAKKTGVIRGGRTHQIADAAKAIAEGATAAAEGKEEPPDVGRSLAQLFSA